MFEIKDDMTIYITRGDIGILSVTADDNGAPYMFQVGDTVRLKVYEKKGCDCVVLQKDFPVTEATEKIDMLLTAQDTRIGEVISKPKDYWYEVELNPDTNPQTIIGYDENGPKIFKLYPEGKEIEYEPGDDAPYLEQLVEKEVNEYLAEHPPKDGEKGDKGDPGEPGVDGKDGEADYSLVANALKGSTSGNAIALDDVSPFEHTLGVKARSKNIVKPPFEVSGTNTLKGVTYTINEDYSITASGKPTTENGVAVKLTDNIDITAYRGKTANIIPRAEDTYSYLYVHLWYVDGTVTYNWMRSTKTTTMIIPDNASYFEIGIAFLSSFSGEETTIYPFIQIGEAVTEYVPYVDVRGAKVMAFGKNLIPYPFTTFSAGTESGVKEIAIEDMGDGGVLLNSINGQPTTETTYVNISNIPLSSRGITDAGYQGFISSKTDDPNVTVAYNSSNDITFIRITKNALLDNFIVYPQIEKGMVSTAFEKGKPYTEYIPLADGTVEGVQSISPNMTLLTDTSGVVLDAQYNKDSNIVIARLIDRIAALEAAAL